MGFPKKEIVEKIRREYPSGCEVVLDRMDDCQAPPVGTHGTVKSVDGTGSIEVAWHTGGSLRVIYGEDACHRIDAAAPCRIWSAMQSAGGRTSLYAICVERRKRWRMQGCQRRNRCLHGRHGRREENEPQKNACLRRTRAWRQIHTG